MNLIEVATCVVAGGSSGCVIMAVFAGERAARQAHVIGAQDKLLAERDARIKELDNECADLGQRCSELRTLIREDDARLKAANAQIAELTPLAERGQRAIEQHRKASRLGRASQLARLAEKRAANSNATAPKKPSRKSATA